MKALIRISPLHREQALHYSFFFAQNAQMKTKIHKANVQPPKRFTRNIKNVAAAFLPDAIIVGKK
jgi:hypothetical protein